MARTIHITRYGELPDIPLLLDQVLLLANQALETLPACSSAAHASAGESDEPALTSSMVNNYVKRKLVPAPVKKRYGREQLSMLTWTCLLKQVMDLKDIDAFFTSVLSRTELAEAYDGFCTDVEALLGASAAPELPLDELILAAAQAVAARIRLLELIEQEQPAEETKAADKAKASEEKKHASDKKSRSDKRSDKDPDKDAK